LQTNGGRAAPAHRHVSPPPAPLQQDDDSGDESEAVSNSDLIDSVISYLQLSKEPVMATTEHSNEKSAPDNMQKVSAYAKIAGRDWTYFVVEQVVNIGRPPDNNRDSTTSASASSPIADLKEMLPVHIDLGPSKIVSRHHASIFYDSEYPEGGGWHVRVNGRNGVKVNTNLLKRGASQQLKSGDILEISGTQMMFVTPGDKAVVDPYFVERAKQMATGEELMGVQHGHPDPTSRSSLPSTLYPTTGNHQPLAPAPYFKRAVTPPPASQKSQTGVFDSKPPQSPMYNRGMLMESTQEIDYSRDAAKDLKPPFSYATMIAQAIFSSDEEKLTLSNIYAWISDKYAFYRHSNSGWQASPYLPLVDFIN
jgi:forkhead protein FKH